MQTSNKSLYDVIIIGAGINGCTSAYFLHKAGLKVALVDKKGVASGGSGAAGAFISPKISKEGILKEIMETAHLEALKFYTEFFPEYTLQKPLLHISKTSEEGGILKSFKNETLLNLTQLDENTEVLLSDEAKNAESICFSKGAVVDAQGVCHALVKGIDFYKHEVQSLHYEENIWNVGNLRASHVVLSIGAYPKIIPLPYLTLRGIWGHRIDIQTSTVLPTILHHYVSISPTSQENIMAIGATHNVHYTPSESEPYNVEEGRRELLEKASRTVNLKNVKIIRDYAGLRSGSNDYIPLLGSLVDAQATLNLHPQLQYGRSVASSEFVNYPNVTMINGSGGYGFVLAPYLASRLRDYLVNKESLDERLSPARFFARWIKRKK
ncbi:MAG: FAD-binding oxidoreductase [Campylobacterales bacterium]|nr:FAD-binding oxidoreductase [Campylobacterales bacterium]